MNGIQYMVDEKGRKVAVQIDLKKYGSPWEDFWDGLISESRRKEKGVLCEMVKADRSKRAGSRRREAVIFPRMERRRRERV